MKALDYPKGFGLTSRSLRLPLFPSEETGVVGENSRQGTVKALDSKYPFFYQITMIFIISSEALRQGQLYLAL